MGWDLKRLTLVGHTSAHNSEQDVIDNDLWQEFCERVAAIAAEHRYETLDIHSQ